MSKLNCMTIWKDIMGYEGLYQVSDGGDIRSVKKGRLIRCHLTPKGYMFASLSKGGKRTSYLLHRIVAMHHISNPHLKPQINHIDGDKLNNNINNLEWCSARENMQHASKFGLINLTEDHRFNSVKWGTANVHNAYEAKRRKVLNIDTGVVYESISAAEKSTGISHLGRMLNGERKNKTRLRYA